MRRPHPFAARVERTDRGIRALACNLAATAEIANSLAGSDSWSEARWREFFRNFGGVP